MPRGLAAVVAVLLVSALVAAQVGGEKSSRGASGKPSQPGDPQEKRSANKDGPPSQSGDARSTSPGSLSREEEERFDQIIERFILYDIGQTQDRKAREELEALGPEAIPALIRGINRAARMSHSCPASVLHRKLKSLLRTTDDERTLRFAYDNLGAGVGRSPYHHLLQDLKLTVVFRRRELDEARRLKAQRGDIPGVDPFAPAGLRPKSPGEQPMPPEDR